jgi:hypothetical protein
MLKVLVATPAGGGMVTTQYLASWSATTDAVTQINTEQKEKGQPPAFHLGLYTLQNESLLPRGRNHCAQVAIKGDWHKLFFIDADAGWTFDQFAAVCTAPFPIVAGTCPLKTYPISMNYLPFQEDEHFYKDAVRSIESLRAMRKGHNSPYIKVPFVGTAFMCIDVSVFKKLSETTDPYQYPSPTTGQLETHWDFFCTKPIKKMYMSEDWGFCHLARQAGFEVHIHADVQITHTGSHTFRVPPPPPEPVQEQLELVPLPEAQKVEIQAEKVEA